MPLPNSVRGRIIAGSGALVIVLIAIVGASLWLSHEQHGVLHEVGENVAVAEHLQLAQHRHTQGILLLETYFASGDEELVPEIRSSFSAARDSIGQALLLEETETGNTAGIDADVEVARLTGILLAMSATGVIIDEAIVTYARGDAAGAEQTLAVAFPEIIRLSADIAAGVEDELLEVSFLQGRSDDLSEFGLRLLLIAGAAGVVISVIAALLIARSILKPLSLLESAALAVASGKLEVRAPATGLRELAHLGASLNQMTESLLDASKRRELEDEREQAYAQLQESEERIRMIVDTASDAFISIDAAGAITAWNRAAEATFGWSREEALGRMLSDTIIPPRLREAHERGLRHFFASGEGPVLNERTEVTALRRDGREFPAELAVWAVTSGEDCAFNAFVHDITERRQSEEIIRHLAYHDPLTDLPNRQLFLDRLNIALAQAHRKEETLAVMFLDLDHFKLVNDTVGHSEGDNLLRSAGERLAGLMREGDTVARAGGDEFTILLSRIFDEEDALDIAERIREAFRRPWALDRQDFHVTASIGIAMYPSDGEDAETLLKNADTAMYRAKEKGRDNFLLYSPAMNIGISERITPSG